MRHMHILKSTFVLDAIILTFAFALCEPSATRGQEGQETSQASHSRKSSSVLASDDVRPTVRLKVTTRELADTSISPLLCSNFIELGFGYQVEGMWSEMLYNRSFECWIPLVAETTGVWYDLESVKIPGNWTTAPWYHSAYDHPRWYAAPGRDAPPHIGPDSTFLIEKSYGLRVRVLQVPGGAHGTHALKILNFEDDAYRGVAQDRKYVRRGESYRFRGRLKRLSDDALKAEVRLYPADGLDWDKPIAIAPLGGIGREDRIYEATFKSLDFEGWATFALLVTPGEVLADALSLTPTETVKGWRPDVVAALKRVNPKLIRFPGGCFASFHDWRDAIGPFDRREPEPSYYWGDINFNDVGTIEFLDLCRKVDAEPMLVVNMFHPRKRYFQVRDRAHGYDLPDITDADEGIKAAADWVAYCNARAGAHPMADLRARHGRMEPYSVIYWEMDNEFARWFRPREYAEHVVRYSRAMKAVDPKIKIGLITYHGVKEIPLMLKIAGPHIDFFADRDKAPKNLTRKIDQVRRYNETHENKLFYANTEMIQHDRHHLDPHTMSVYLDAGLIPRQGPVWKKKRAMRTWGYALSLASNILAFQREGGTAKFLCFNNLANTMGQSCIETPKEGAILTGPGYVFELMSRSPAAWLLEIERYQAVRTDTVQVQTAWDAKRENLVIHMLNRGPTDARFEFDLSALGRIFTGGEQVCLSAADTLTVETAKSLGNIHRTEEQVEQPLGASVLRLNAPKFSLMEVTLR